MKRMSKPFLTAALAFVIIGCGDPLSEDEFGSLEQAAVVECTDPTRCAAIKPPGPMRPQKLPCAWVRNLPGSHCTGDVCFATDPPRPQPPNYIVTYTHGTIWEAFLPTLFVCPLTERHIIQWAVMQAISPGSFTERVLYDSSAVFQVESSSGLAAKDVAQNFGWNQLPLLSIDLYDPLPARLTTEYVSWLWLDNAWSGFIPGISPDESASLVLNVVYFICPETHYPCSWHYNHDNLPGFWISLPDALVVGSPY